MYCNTWESSTIITLYPQQTSLRHSYQSGSQPFSTGDISLAIHDTLLLVGIYVAKKSGTVVSISLFTWLYKNKRTGLPLLERLGQYTLEIYALHFILIHLALYHYITIPYTSLIYELLYCPAITVMILVWCDYAYWSSIGTKQQSYCSLENRAWEAGYPENA